MKTKSLGFIGGGRITRIFLQAFTNKKHEFESVVVFDTNAEVLQALKQQFPFIQTGDLQQAGSQPSVFLALHPPVMMETLDKIADTVPTDALVISLAPKITIGQIASKLKTPNILRMIPNATSYINEGYNPVTFATGFSPAEKSELLDLLRLLGTTFEVAEAKLEAYAILSAMLPTYFWFQWNELTQLGEPMGLTSEETKAAVRQSLQAALDIYFDHGLLPEQVTDLIPVKPIGEHEAEINHILNTKLMGLFEKIKNK
ncbi:pyrroline-5-carboxylate reductase family protein [Gaoshiqia sp. Z1-71]|uniref:pyrroline-5-carboxylate reductase family protein n=1 Tax=Gaoshiqia hydrogeniformans TaxID=3290090 RepID=UPI003BF7918C